MKRNVTIAAITAAVLISGTTAATVAFADSDGDRDRTSTRSANTVSLADDRDDRTDDASDDRSDDRADDRAPAAAKNAGISLDQAVAAALKSVPGTVTGAELDRDDDDHDGRAVWELDVRGSDKKWHDVTVDAGNGKVLKTRDDDNDDRDDHAPRSSAVTLNEAAAAALKTAPGTITSIDLDDDDDDNGSRSNVLRWDVDVAGKDGKQHELRVDAKTGKVTVDRDDDGDDRDDRADDRNDDRDDQGDDRDGDDD
ncbi:PepSY domain-containing protein [Streptomyces sp. MBT67]|uniref:PepSY domain-containing protein n=1 Tax=Streptomyces TaxID=1883 RepID=UPI00190B724E|nr:MULTISPECIES: PepSY domain-containing protein [unclassified Streptomyces]MBK3531858.1 PepSY domain-containing protein [Streptomyces sp. MBT72]MBK3536644.1 PepSY domain-containing protein [Streptomyces sp. MBT67]MBK3544377.1 PepSY domain-containing protein [Streptomyces sp. MBT60]MBK3550589.1 PepSY domain-containing protein [Streptomyces sp. MBT61]MBK6029943.1 PepSY domain-containing protein [Streptomyces sp. MBT59]